MRGGRGEGERKEGRKKKVMERSKVIYEICICEKENMIEKN